MITPVGGFREFAPAPQSSHVSNSVKEEGMEMEDAGHSEQSSSEAEPESIWCHPLLDSMECGEESGERSHVDHHVAAENEDLKEKLLATEQIFDTCHRSLKEKETMIQELREMVKMKQRKIRRLEERIAQLEANQLLLSSTVSTANAISNDTAPNEAESSTSSAGEAETTADIASEEIETEAEPAENSLFTISTLLSENTDCEPIAIVQLLQKLRSLSPRYHELVLSTLQNCLPKPAPITTHAESSPLKRDEEVVCPVARDQPDVDHPAPDPVHNE
jgi:hypothetical protein